MVRAISEITRVRCESRHTTRSLAGRVYLRIECCTQLRWQPRDDHLTLQFNAPARRDAGARVGAYKGVNIETAAVASRPSPLAQSSSFLGFFPLLLRRRTRESSTKMIGPSLIFHRL